MISYGDVRFPANRGAPSHVFHSGVYNYTVWNRHEMSLERVDFCASKSDLLNGVHMICDFYHLINLKRSVRKNRYRAEEIGYRILGSQYRPKTKDSPKVKSGYIETPRNHKQEGYRGLSESSLWHSCRQDNTISCTKQVYVSSLMTTWTRLFGWIVVL